MNEQNDTKALAGRCALVTGGGVGIGRAIVEQLAAAGAYVGIHCNRSVDEANQTLEVVRSHGGDGEVLQADLADYKQAGDLVNRLVGSAGRLDILVNNAGSPVQRVSIEECPLDVWRSILDVNLTSAFIVTQQAIPHLRKSGNGSIINNLTLSIQTGGSGGAGPYAAAKGALQVMTRTLAKELAPQVRTNAIMPGVIDTRHHEVYSNPEKMKAYAEQTPLGRNGEAHEVASAVRFLASDESRFINGALIDINGGRFLR